MGLPHILVRFYTNPDGSAARRTTVRVLGLLGVFYLFPAVYGLLGRAFTPELYVTGDTDSRRPARARRRVAGPDAATSSPRSSPRARSPRSCRPPPACWCRSPARSRTTSCPGKRAAAPRRGSGSPRSSGMVPPALLALATREVDISVLVGWAFALAASTFCPLLLLGVWWPRLTARGAAAGMLAGRDRGHRHDRRRADRRRVARTPRCGAILTQPAAVSVPIAFATMVAALAARARPGT